MRRCVQQCTSTTAFLLERSAARRHTRHGPGTSRASATCAYSAVWLSPTCQRWDATSSTCARVDAYSWATSLTRRHTGYGTSAQRRSSYRGPWTSGKETLGGARLLDEGEQHLSQQGRSRLIHHRPAALAESTRVEQSAAASALII